MNLLKILRGKRKIYKNKTDRKISSIGIHRKISSKESFLILLHPNLYDDKEKKINSRGKVEKV